MLAADLTDPAQLASVEGRLADRDRPVDVLVNNAGYGTNGDFAQLDRDTEAREIGLNVVALVRLTHAALAPMLERGRGAVLNVGSLAGGQPNYRQLSEIRYEATRGIWRVLNLLAEHKACCTYFVNGATAGAVR